MRQIFTAVALLASSAALAAQPTTTKLDAVSGIPKVDDTTQRQDIKFKNQRDDRMTVPVTLSGTGPFQFLVDTGATDSMVSASDLKRIGVVPTGKRAYELATGEQIEFEVGYAELSFMGDTIQTRVIFGPDDIEPILGAVAMELAGLVVDPTNQMLRRLPALPLK